MAVQDGETPGAQHPTGRLAASRAARGVARKRWKAAWARFGAATTRAVERSEARKLSRQAAKYVNP